MYRLQNQIVNSCLALLLLPLLASAAHSADAPPGTAADLRCVVIGNPAEADFWNALTARFTADTGVKLKVISVEPKDHPEKSLKEHGGFDLVTGCSSDTIINLVADGYALDPQPWMKADLLLVGPAEDPAGIKGMTDVAAAIGKIVAAKSPIVVSGDGSDQSVLREILAGNSIAPDADHLTTLYSDDVQQLLKIAGEKHAYALVNRLAFLSGTISTNGLAAMVHGDEKLRYSCVAAIANTARFSDAQSSAARRLVEYVRSPDSQAWIARFGKGKLDDEPLMYPIDRPALVQSAADHLVLNVADQGKSYDLTALSKLPHEDRHVLDHLGKPAVYSGIPLRFLLTDAGLSLDANPLHGKALANYLVARGSDGYEVVVALPELDTKADDMQPIVADTRDGKSLDVKEGPLRLIIPADAKQYRCVRQLVSVEMKNADAK